MAGDQAGAAAATAASCDPDACPPTVLPVAGGHDTAAPDTTPEPVASPPTVQLSGDVYGLGADPQVPFVKDRKLRLQLLTGLGLPADRLPVCKLGVTAVLQYILRRSKEHAEQDLKGNYHGMKLFGDLGDTAAMPEGWILEDEVAQAVAADPSLGLSGLPAPGNHDAFHLGTFNSGLAFFFFQFLVNTESYYRNYTDNIWSLEAGGKENIMTKERFLQFVYQMFGLKWDPVKLDEPFFGDYTVQGKKGKFPWKTKDEEWLGRDGRLKNEPKPEFSNFWRPVGEGKKSWTALMDYLPNDDEASERRYLFLSADLMSEQVTSAGKTPVYLINLDTIDFLTMSSRDGAIFGHMSPIQTRLVQSFIAEMKRQNPNAKFVLGSHFPLDDIEEAGVSLTTLFSPSKWFAPKSKFYEVLNDEAVLGVISGHSHDWGYKDLNTSEYAEKLGFDGRKTPFFQYKVTSMIDQPVGFGQLHIHAEGDDLKLDFHKFNLDWRQLYPQADPMIQEEFVRMQPHIASSVSALHKIIGAKYRFQADRRQDDFKKTSVTMDYNQGTYFEPGRAIDSVNAKDGIMLTVENTQSQLRLYMGILRLELHRLGCGTQVDSLSRIFAQHMDNMDAYFEHALTHFEARTKDDGATPHNISLDTFTVPFLRVINEVSLAMEARYGRGNLADDHGKAIPELTYHEYRDLLKKMDDGEKAQVIVHLLFMLEGIYRHWIKRFKQDLVERTPDERDPYDFLYELGHDNDLLAGEEWQRMEQTIRALSLKSPSKILRSMLALRGAEIDQQYKRKLPTTDAPDNVTVTVNMKTGKVSMTDPIVLSEKLIEQRERELPPPQCLGDKEFDNHRGLADSLASQCRTWTAMDSATLREEVKKEWKAWEEHWVVDVGTRGEFDSWRDSWPSAYTMQAGYQGNWWPAKLNMMRLTHRVVGDFKTDGPKGMEVGGTVGAYADAGGILALGVDAGVGTALGELGHKGDEWMYYNVGPRLSVMEGVVSVGLMHSWYRQVEDGAKLERWQYYVMLDFMAWLRAFNLVDRDL